MAAPSFRRLTEDDLPLLHEWLNREHVARWWHERPTLEQVAAHYLPSIQGDDPTDLYAIVLDGREAGMVQTYLVADYPRWADATGVGDGVAGLDLFLAEEALLGRGLGTEVLRAFVRDVVFARPEVSACVADPEVGNAASLRAFEKAGFRRVREFFDPEQQTTNVLVRLDR
ncbi:MAG TPA: GNAT family N-acetyltransferase [Gaiellaceae bacterium]|nr:GNAT family N-acetyltransferase [Gaiellaceae bacterium]